MVLDGPGWSLMVLDGPGWSWMVLDGPRWVLDTDSLQDLKKFAKWSLTICQPLIVRPFKSKYTGEKNTELFSCDISTAKRKPCTVGYGYYG